MLCRCFRKTSGYEIRDFYRIGHVLGQGSFGQVRVSVRKSDGKMCAVKIMAKEPPKDRRGASNVDFDTMFRNEVGMLDQLDHENIVRYFEFFEDRHFLYAVIEKCDGGELFTQIVNKRKFTEEDAARLCRQMLEAINYIHDSNIVHRDIKAENFLFSDRTPNSRLVLIDFGMSTRLTDDRWLKQLCGSPHYVAPELIKRCYRFKVDLWALGVLIYLMLYGRYPFEGADQKSIVHQILKSEPDYSRGPISASPLAINFMQGLLAKNPEDRLQANDALNHPWVSPQNRNNALYQISGDVVLQAHRKMSLERNFPRKLQEANQKRYDKKLAELNTEHTKQERQKRPSLSTTKQISLPKEEAGLPPERRDI